MGNPLSLLALVAVYVYFVKAGPKFMQNRKPLNLDSVIIAYNMVQILVNAYFTVIVSTLYLGTYGSSLMTILKINE